MPFENEKYPLNVCEKEKIRAFNLLKGKKALISYI